MKQRHCLRPRVTPMPGTARNCGPGLGKLEGSKITVDNDFLITRLVGGESSLEYDTGEGIDS